MKTKNQKGITLVALVITIIVLLILAGVTINLTLGERGIFSTAQKAAENYKTAQEKEFASLNNFEDEMNNTINNSLGIYSVGETITLGGVDYYVMTASDASSKWITLLRVAPYGSYNWSQACIEGTNYASSLGYTSAQATSRLITKEEATALSDSMRTTGNWYWTSTAYDGSSSWVVSSNGNINIDSAILTSRARPVLVILKSLI